MWDSTLRLQAAAAVIYIVCQCKKTKIVKLHWAWKLLSNYKRKSRYLAWPDSLDVPSPVWKSDNSSLLTSPAQTGLTSLDLYIPLSFARTKERGKEHKAVKVNTRKSVSRWCHNENYINEHTKTNLATDRPTSAHVKF